MKFIIVVVVLFSFILMIPIMLVHANALEYKNEDNGFSIEYPAGWNVDDTFYSQDNVDYLVTFYDDVDGWSSMLEVRYLSASSLIQIGTDSQWLGALNEGIRQGCESATIEDTGYSCSNNKLIDSKIVYIDGRKSYQLIYSWTETSNNSMQYENISTATFIPNGYNSWNIYSESTTDIYQSHKNQILAAINSFDILKSDEENARISESKRPSRIIFEDNAFSFLDLSKTVRPTNLIVPKEFTPEWYVNIKNNFAIKFPNTFAETWLVNENFSGYKKAEFTSKNTDGKIEIFKQNKDTFHKLKSLDKEGIYQESQKLITESIDRFPGVFNVNNVIIAEYEKEISISTSFFQIDDAGNLNTYDVTYLIYENGDFFEILYYGDNYTTIDLNTYAMMIESFYVGNTSSIPIVNESKINSEIYINYELGFSFIPPKNWKQFELNSQMEPTSIPLKINILTSFIPANFQGLYPPMIVVFHTDVGTPINFDEDTDKEIMDNTIAGIKDVIEKTAPFEITNSNLERFEHSIKITVGGILKLDIDGAYIERQLQMIAWEFENGQIYYFLLATDKIDYENFITDFQTSIDTVSFKSESQPTCGSGTELVDGKCQVIKTEKTTSSSKGGGCLIATAAYGSELAPQVQQLRELRDNSLLQTESGTNFMNSFNQFYYSFSPTIADMERENPVFKEAVKLTLTPMISSLSILNHVDMDSEAKVLGYGISLILLNVGMYFVAPTIVIVKIKQKL